MMKRLAYYVCGLVCLSLGCPTVLTAGAVVWPAVQMSSLGSGQYIMSADAVSPDGSGAGMWMSVLDGGSSATFQATAATVAIGQIWYQSSGGAPVNSSTVIAATPFADNTTYTLGSIDVAKNETFYLGFWLGTTPGGPNSVYGWASLVYNGTTLIILDSAAETTGVGIYTGTYTPIPEPCSAGLALIGLAAITVRRSLRPREG